jgi:hypothetical protein
MLFRGDASEGVDDEKKDAGGRALPAADGNLMLNAMRNRKQDFRPPKIRSQSRKGVEDEVREEDYGNSETK